MAAYNGCPYERKLARAVKFRGSPYDTSDYIMTGHLIRLCIQAVLIKLAKVDFYILNAVQSYARSGWNGLAGLRRGYRLLRIGGRAVSHGYDTKHEHKDHNPGKALPLIHCSQVSSFEFPLSYLLCRLPPLDKISYLISNLDEFGIGYVSRVGEINKDFLFNTGWLLGTH